MTDDSPKPPAPTHGVDEGYDFQTIRAQLGGEKTPPNFVIHRGDAVLGVCLGLLWNPRAESDPVEVWVGKKGELPRWGAKLAETTGPLPVYVRRREGGLWHYTGLHEVTGNTTEAEAIRQRLQPPVITAISRIVFLKRVGTNPPPPLAK